MSFRDSVQADIQNVYMNTAEFAERRTVKYDGKSFDNIPILLSGVKQQARDQKQDDYVQGLYAAVVTMHCSKDDLRGIQPEKGMRIQISDDDGFFREYYITTSDCEVGMVKLRLEAIDE